MLINRSSKYNDKCEFWHDDRQRFIQRAFGGVSFSGQPKSVVVVGEESAHSGPNFYLLAEGYTEPESGEGITDLVGMCRRLEAEYNVTRWFGRVDENVKETMAICNRMAHSSGLRSILITDIPRIGDFMDEQISLIHTVTRKEDKRLFFFGESILVGELMRIPKSKIKDEEWPRAAALANAISGLLKYTHEHYTPEQFLPEIEPIF